MKKMKRNEQEITCYLVILTTKSIEMQEREGENKETPQKNFVSLWGRARSCVSGNKYEYPTKVIG